MLTPVERDLWAFSGCARCKTHFSLLHALIIFCIMCGRALDLVLVCESREYADCALASLPPPPFPARLRSVIISSDEDDLSPEFYQKTLREVGLHDISLLEASDFLQKYELRINVRHRYGNMAFILLLVLSQSLRFSRTSPLIFFWWVSAA